VTIFLDEDTGFIGGIVVEGTMRGDVDRGDSIEFVEGGGTRNW